MPRSSRSRLAASAAVLSLLRAVAWAQAPAALPAPSGPHAVGRTSFHWVDSNRPEVATESAEDKREILVQVWYPAVKGSGKVAPYWPEAARLNGSPAAGSFAALFGPAWSSIVSGTLRTHSLENAAVVVSGQRLPILIFSPGGGVPVMAYTALVEDLASHGYVVAGVNPTYELPAIVFPDGRVIPEADAFWDRMRRQSSNPEAFEKTLTDMRAADLRFAVDKLTDLDSDARSRFRGRLDLARVGVFGHSRGGRAAVRACQLDDRFKACVNEDGNMRWHPYWPDPSGRPLRQPFLMLDHLDPDPPDEAFKQMGTTREEYARRRAARRAEARATLYEGTEGGSYHVTIKTPGVSHNSFTDIRQLGRPDGDGINTWPADVRAVTPHAQILKAIGAWTRAFFDSSVRGIPATLAELMRTPSGEVEARQYSPRQR